MFVLAGGFARPLARFFFLVYFTALGLDFADDLYHGRTPPQQRAAREAAAARAKAKTPAEPRREHNAEQRKARVPAG